MTRVGSGTGQSTESLNNELAAARESKSAALGKIRNTQNIANERVQIANMSTTGFSSIAQGSFGIASADQKNKAEQEQAEANLSQAVSQSVQAILSAQTQNAKQQQDAATNTLGVLQ
jgi:hypothetical protein